MINILVIIIIILLLIILSLLITKYFLIHNDNNFSKSNNTEMYNNEMYNDEMYNNIENFSNKKNDNIIQDSNLIKNGSFENGVAPSNFVNQSGINKIVSIKNPGNTSYALQQKKSNEITYYQLTSENNINSKYILLFWVCITDKNNNQPNINDVSFESLIKIKIQNQDFTNFIPRLNYNIIQKTTISENNYNWYLLKYDFLSGSENLDKMQIYLNYSDSLQYDIYYFTDLSLFRVLIDAQNFIYNNSLICYTDGYNYQSNSTTWHDLSGNGNDLFWSKIPDTNSTIGSLNTSNLSLTCMKSSVLSNTSNTIALCLNQDIMNSASDNYVNTSEEEEEQYHKDLSNNSDFYLLSVPGNNRYAFELKIVNKTLYLIIDNTEYKSSYDFIFYNKSLLFITYDGTKLNVYQDGLLLISVIPRKLYFNNNKIIINRNKNLNINLYSTLFYNRVIKSGEMNDIREYFITNKNKNYNRAPDINTFHMSNYFMDNIIGNYPIYKPYDKKRNCEYNDSDMSSIFDNTSDKIKKAFISCNKDCIEQCLHKSKDGLNSFYNCASTCKNTLDSCKDLCKADPQNPYYCKMKNASNCGISNCPKVIKKNGNYIVYIPEHSNYAKELKYSGEKIYSRDIHKARTLYNLNFPECPTPKELILKELNNNVRSCPFVVNEANPCITTACSGVNWNKDNYKELALSKNCKKMVSNYCNINYGLDDKCICWDPKYKNDKRCNEFRAFFDEPNEFCTPSQFSIEDHPDFSKYIKKDNIPCWGCKI